jgi:FxLD family lantipeptide
MTTTTTPPPLTTALPLPAGTGSDALDLDVRIVETGDPAHVLLGNTDDGCDTVRGGDC